jgi:hypothetical protein
MRLFDLEEFYTFERDLNKKSLEAKLDELFLSADNFAERMEAKTDRIARRVQDDIQSALAS